MGTEPQSGQSGFDHMNRYSMLVSFDNLAESGYMFYRIDLSTGVQIEFCQGLS